MLIEMRAAEHDLLGAVHRHLERRVRAALATLAGQVSQVTLELADLNGPKGGADLRCVVTAELLPRGSARAEATDVDLVSAVGRALARVRRTIRHQAHADRRGQARGTDSRASAFQDTIPEVRVRGTRRERARHERTAGPDTLGR
jgi:hypothetical protein